MLKKAVYGIVVGSLMFAAQGASAIGDSTFPASALESEPWGAVAPMGQSAGQAPAQTQYSYSESPFPASALESEPWGAVAPIGQPARQYPSVTRSSSFPAPALESEPLN